MHREIFGANHHHSCMTSEHECDNNNNILTMRLSAYINHANFVGQGIISTRLIRVYYTQLQAESGCTRWFAVSSWVFSILWLLWDAHPLREIILIWLGTMGAVQQNKQNETIKLNFIKFFRFYRLLFEFSMCAVV